MKPQNPRANGILTLLRSLHIDREALEARSKAAVIDEVISDVLRHNTRANPEKVGRRIEKLIEQIKRTQALGSGLLTAEIMRARIDCFIFIFTIQLGWGSTRKLPSGAVIVEDTPVCGMMRLGYPTPYRVKQAYKRVRAICPEEAAQYKLAFKEFKEAHRRYTATLSEASWNWYVCGDGNKNSVAYRTKVDLSHRYGWVHFRNRRGFKYMAHELLPRTEERKRAQQEMREANARLKEKRKRIFEKMGVPLYFRSLV